MPLKSVLTKPHVIAVKYNNTYVTKRGKGAVRKVVSAHTKFFQNQSSSI